MHFVGCVVTVDVFLLMRGLFPMLSISWAWTCDELLPESCPLLAVSRFALVHVLLLVGIRTCDFGFSKVRSRSIWNFSDRARSQILAISPLTPCRII